MIKIEKQILQSTKPMVKLAIVLTAILVALYTTGNAIAKVETDLLVEPEISPNCQSEKEITEPTVEEVKEEITKQSQLFGVDTRYALAIADCESGFDFQAKNPNSTARGVYQYLIATWEVTKSAKAGKERNDYKANIREAMIDLANGEDNKWQECLNII